MANTSTAKVKTESWLTVPTEKIQEYLAATEVLRRLDYEFQEDTGVNIYAQGNLQTMHLQVLLQATIDSTILCNFKKHGIDARGQIGDTEAKSYKSKSHHLGRDAAFQFHGNAKHDYDNFVFFVWDGKQICRFYATSNADKVKAVLNCLAIEKQKWIDKGGQSKSFDGIYVPEGLLRSLFEGEQLYSFTEDGVVSVEGDIREASEGEVRFYTDYRFPTDISAKFHV